VSVAAASSATAGPGHCRDLDFSVHSHAGRAPLNARVTETIIAGWTGRDRTAMMAHIDELAALGVAPPPRTPMFYRVGCARLTTAPVIEVCGQASSGEVEFVILNHGGVLYIGVGSDHTDRTVETYDITTAKQMCDKPLAPTLWPWEEIHGHWDQLILRSSIGTETARETYQEGSVAALLAPLDLIAAAHAAGIALAAGSLMYCGTLSAIGGIRPARHFAFELVDPLLERRIHHAYEVRPLALAI